MFEMTINDVFHFQDGRTVFAGVIDESIKFVRPCTCEVWVDGNLSGKVRIEGEMITDGPSPKLLRAVSTLDPVQLDHDVVSKYECTLKSAG